MPASPAAQSPGVPRGKRRLHCHISAELHQRVRQTAATLDITVTDIVETILDAGFADPRLVAKLRARNAQQEAA